VKEFHRLARHWDALARGKVKKKGEVVPDLDEPADFELERRFLLSRFREQQLTRVEAEALPGGEEFRLYRVQFKPSRPELLHGAHRMGVAFGAWSFRLPSSVAMVVAGIESTLASVIAGLAGVIFALVVTASFIPDMLQKGRIDILLSKPIRRPTLLVYKYLGGLLYVFLNAAFLVGGCWLALAVRSRHWDPSFLWTVPILTAAFAILYSFSSWLGVLTRSPIVCILGSLGLWFVSSMAGQVRRFFSHPLTPMEIPGWVRKSLDAVYYVLPKTSDLGQINSVLIHRGNMGSDGDAILEQVGMLSLDWPMILASSVGFMALFLSLACFSFSKRDY
jgi:ABC-type transport system involved in multi-copper enzyme maturation permease subunit